MRVLIVGAGMYVTGRNGSGPGVILAALLETAKQYPLTQITVVSLSESARHDVAEAATRLSGLLGVVVAVAFQSLGSDYLANFDRMLETQQFGACVISTPDHLHFDYAAAALRRGIPCLVVKPLTPTLAEAKALVDLQRQQQVYGAVEFHKRWDESNLYVKRQIQAGALGQLAYMVTAYSQRISIPTVQFRGWASQTNIFQYLGVHYVDLAYFFTGYRPVRVSAVGNQGILEARGIPTYDAVHVQVAWENPADPGQLFWTFYNTNWVEPEQTTAMSDQKFFIVGSAGRLDCNQKNRGIEEVTEQGGVRSLNPYFADFLPADDGKFHFQGYGHRSIFTFIADVFALKAGHTRLAELESSRPSFQDALVSTAVIEAVNHSLSTQGAWQNIDL